MTNNPKELLTYFLEKKKQREKEIQLNALIMSLPDNWSFVHLSKIFDIIYIMQYLYVIAEISVDTFLTVFFILVNVSSERKPASRLSVI